MSEDRPEYVVEPKELDDAMEMLGQGYEVHAPHKVMTMGENFHLVETEEGAWIKLSTTFRSTLSYLKGASLSVFIALCLGINENGETYPALDTLAGWSGYSRRATIDAVNELEKMGFLTKIQGAKKSTLYKINAFAAFGEHNQPTSAKIAPVQKSARRGAKNDTENPENVLKFAPELESLTRANNKTPTQKTDKKGTGLAFDELNLKHAEREKKLQDMMERVEKTIHVRPSMGNPKWETVIKKLLKLQLEGQTIEHYAEWVRANKFDAPKVGQIAQNPYLILDTWPAAFMPVASPEAEGYRTL